MIIETLAIGDEILRGTIADSHSTEIAEKLLKKGLELSRQTVVGDDVSQIQRALSEISERADLCIAFGGLGPTSDDQTAFAISQLLNCSLVKDEISEKKIIEYLEPRGRLNSFALKQALYPQAALPLQNAEGFAPAFTIKIKKAQCFFLPGVPREMRYFVDHVVLPSLPTDGTLKTNRWRCIGIGESDLQSRLQGFEQSHSNDSKIGYRTLFSENHVTLYYRGTKFKDRIATLDRILSDVCYGKNDEILEALILEELTIQNKTLAFAESCTGGLLAHRMSSLAGASKVFWGSFVTYQAGAKEEMLGVTPASPETAVSQEITSLLARRALEKSGCSVAMGITGFMGPTAIGQEVGTVYYAASDRSGRHEQKRWTLPPRERKELLWATSSYALKALLDFLRKS